MAEHKTHVIVILGDSEEGAFRRNRDRVKEVCGKFGFSYEVLRNSRRNPLTAEKVEAAFQLSDSKGCDQLVVWYTGHGAANWSFALWDDTDISSYDLFTMLANGTRAKELLVISDSCGSGAMRDDLIRWFNNHAAELTGSRRLTFCAGTTGFGEGAATSMYGWQGRPGTAFTIALYRGLMDPVVKVNPAQPFWAWKTFFSTVKTYSDGAELVMSAGLGCISQTTSFASVVGPAK